MTDETKEKNEGEKTDSLSKHSRMQINDTKAGMENIDKEKINAIIKKHSQSKFRFLTLQGHHADEIINQFSLFFYCCLFY